MPKFELPECEYGDEEGEDGGEDGLGKGHDEQLQAREAGAQCRDRYGFSMASEQFEALRDYMLRYEAATAPKQTRGWKAWLEERAHPELRRLREDSAGDGGKKQAARREREDRPSLIPSLCTHLARAGIEWRR